MEVVKNKKIKYHFITLNSVLIFMNSVFAPMIGIKMGYHFNNLIFFLLKNIIKFSKYEMKYICWEEQ